MAFDRSEFLSTFADEAKDHLQKLNQGLLNLEKNPEDPSVIEEMFREGHTLKGAARMMGFEEIKEVSHCIEDIFGAIHNKEIFLDVELSNAMFKSLDVITLILEDILAGRDISADWQGCVNELKSMFQEYLEKKKITSTQAKASKKSTKKSAKKTVKKTVKKKPAASQEETDVSSEDEEEDELTFDKVKKELAEKGILESPLDELLEEQEQAVPVPEFVSSSKNISASASTQKNKPAEIEEYIKVSINKVNKLLNLVGEMVINKINSNEKVNSLRRMVRSSRLIQKKLVDLSSVVLSMPQVSQTHAYKDIKLNFHEVNHELIKLRENLVTVFDDISLEVSQLDPIIDELQLRMKQIRMLPIVHLFETMPRLVRDIAVAQGKKIDLEISGEETELDKKVLEAIKGSFIHLLRNSVDHGIESPEDREANGKSPVGSIKLRAYHKGGNVVIEVEDDGRGIDKSKIKDTVIRRGLASASDLESLTTNEIFNFIFYPGFSTAPIITDISGRGVGLDVVKTDIESLKGNINIKSELGKGTTFTLQLPLTVAIIQALLVRCNNEIFAIPLLSVEESVSVKRSDISTIENRSAIRIRNKTISMVKLTELLGLPEDEQSDFNDDSEKDKESFVVILNSMDKLLGIEVDEIMGEQEVFIKSLDKKLGKLQNVSGATVLGNGQVIIILDILDLFLSSKTISFYQSGFRRREEVKEMEADVQKESKKVLIVEDSLTTRELEKSILHSHGYDVETSVDGVDALSRLQNKRYDLIVSDVEMPRMDGFELCRTVKQNPKLKDIPFVVVSSLDRKEDKRKGVEVGAQAYIVKSAFDQSSLVDAIKRLIG